MEPPAPDLPDLDRMALLVVDVQQGFDDAEYWGPRNNPACEQNIATLLAEWRTHSRPVVFARHDSSGATSPLRVGESGEDLKAIMTGQPDQLVSKHVNSGQLAVGRVSQLTLAFDHRVCDGGAAGGFLRFVADCVESPVLALGNL